MVPLALVLVIVLCIWWCQFRMRKVRPLVLTDGSENLSNDKGVVYRFVIPVGDSPSPAYPMSITMVCSWFV